MNHKKQLLENTIIIAIGKLSTQIISYLLLPLFTAKLAPSEYGVYDFVCTLGIFLYPFLSFLMEESMFRFLIDAKSETEKKKIVSQTMIFMSGATLAFIPVSIIIFNLFTKYNADFIFAFIIFIVSNLGILLVNCLLRGESKIKLYSVSNFILGVITVILDLVFILGFKTGAEGLLWANTISNLITTIIIAYKLKIKKYFGNIDKSLMKKMLKYSIPLIPNSVSWAIINMSDRIILTQMIGSDANGIYAMSSKFPNIISVVYGYFYTAWKESAAKIIKDKNKQEFYNSIYHDVKKLLYCVTLVLIAIMPFAFPIFINPQYGEAYKYIPIIMIATYFANLSSFYGGIFTAFKETKIMGTTTLVAALINLIIDLIFIKKLEIYAACFSTLIADLIIYYYRRYKIREYIKLKELRWQGPFIIMTIIVGAYYMKYIPHIPMTLYWICNIITLVLALVYSYFNNSKFVLEIKNKIFKSKREPVYNESILNEEEIEKK